MNAEQIRLSGIVRDMGREAAMDFAARTYPKYRECLLLKRRVLDARGMKDKKPHHATFREFRRGFVESCVVFRRFIRKGEL